jgi:hypothetical protein
VREGDEVLLPDRDLRLAAQCLLHHRPDAAQAVVVKELGVAAVAQGKPLHLDAEALKRLLGLRGLWQGQLKGLV